MKLIQEDENRKKRELKQEVNGIRALLANTIYIPK